MPEFVIVTGVVWVLVAIWTFIVTPSWVRVPADAYGTQLLAACDTLDADGEKAARKPSTRGESVTLALDPQAIWEHLVP